MMFEAAAGLATGLALAATCAGVLRFPGRAGAGRVIAALAAVLFAFALLGIAASAPAEPGALPSLGRFAALLAGAVGLVASGMPGASPIAPIVSAAFLLYATLNPALLSASDPAEPVIATVATVLAAAATVPVLDAAWRQWHRLPYSAAPAGVAWVILTVALAADLVYGLAWRGAWPGVTAAAILVLAAWIASSGSRLVQPGRSQAALVAVAAALAAMSALSL